MLGTTSSALVQPFSRQSSRSFHPTSDSFSATDAVQTCNAGRTLRNMVLRQWGGLFCWVCSVVTVYTPIKIDLFLTALAAIAAWFIPGLIMEKEYRLYKKEQTLPDV